MVLAWLGTLLLGVVALAAPEPVSQITASPPRPSEHVSRHFSMFELAAPTMRYFDPAQGRVDFNTTTGVYSAFDGASSPPSYVVVNQHLNDPTISTVWNFNLASDLVNMGHPAASHFLFLSSGYDYCGSDQNTHSVGLSNVQANAVRTANSLNAMSNQVLAQQWQSRLHFITDDPLRTGTWFSDQLLCSPSIGKSVITVEITDVANPNQMGPLLRTLFEAVAPAGTWLSPVFPVAGGASPLSDIPVAFYGTCTATNTYQTVTGKIAVVVRSTSCSHVTTIRRAVDRGAVGVIVVAASTETPTALTCTGSSCTGLTNIPAVMIPYTIGSQLSSFLQTTGKTPPLLKLDLQMRVRPGAYFAFDRNTPQTPRQFGSLPSLALRNLKDELTIFEYELQQVYNQPADLVLPVWTTEPIGQLKTQTLTLPDIASFNTLALETRISCYLTDNYWCTDWDYLVRLYVRLDNNGTALDVEIGRWVSGYSMPGVWITDVTPALATLASNAPATFVLKVDGWLDSQITLKLRFSHREGQPRPLALVSLFEGGWFRLDYNTVRRRQANYTIRALFHNESIDGYPVVSGMKFYSFTTGHGWGRDVANCAEFCNHAHHIKVNSGPTYILNFPEAGNQTGCSRRVLDGVTPNQYGTWYFGRGGWCPSLDVKPWVIDLTPHLRIDAIGDRQLYNAEFLGAVPLTYPYEDVHLQDISVDLGYKALFNGQDYLPVLRTNPDPNGFAAQIQHSSYLVVYGYA